MGETRRILLVDGYNVIRSTEPYRRIAEVDMDSARLALVSDVAAYAQGEWEATLVFDGGANVHSTGAPHDMIGVTVIFSKYGMDADSVLESLARDARETGRDVFVVTSDAQLQWAVMGGSVVRKSSAGFSRDLGQAASDWQEHSPSGSRKVPLGDRLDPQTRDRLARWARGEE